MKHFYTAVAIFLVIISGSVFSHLYTRQYLNTVEIQIKTFSEATTFDENNSSRIENIKSSFKNKKNMLQLVVNKEHINNIELNILLIENSVKNEDIQTCQEKSIEILNTISQIEDYLTAID